MKKFIAVLLTAATAASLAVAAFADKPVTADPDAAVTASAVLYGPDDQIITDKVVLPVKYERVDAGSPSVKPGSDIYIQLPKNTFADEDIWKVKVDKGDDNAKLIEKISVVEKDEGFGSDGNIGRAGRTALIKIELRDIEVTDEYKFSPQVKFTSKVENTIGSDNPSSEVIPVEEDCTYIVDISGWMGNYEVTGDQDWAAGQAGYVAKPVKDDDNEVTWHNESGDIARLTFRADSDVTKYYPKLTTKWVDSTYNELIGNSDAYLVDFAGRPQISSTSRATLEIYNPFVNDDGEYDVPVENIRVYQVDAEGALQDITDQCTLGANDNDEEVITLRTRQLGAYVVTDGTAVADYIE